MSTWLSLLSVALLTGVVSGSYPAFYLSGFSSSTILKGKLVTSFGEQWARKGLVIFQFVISVVLMMSVFVVYKQLEYIRSKNLGYNKDHLLYFDVNGMRPDRIETLVSEAKKIPGVVNATTFAHNLSGTHGGYSGVQWEGKDPAMDIDFSNLEVDHDFLRIMGIQLSEGEYFSQEMSLR